MENRYSREPYGFEERGYRRGVDPMAARMSEGGRSWYPEGQYRRGVHPMTAGMSESGRGWSRQAEYGRRIDPVATRMSERGRDWSPEADYRRGIDPVAAGMSQGRQGWRPEGGYRGGTDPVAAAMSQGAERSGPYMGRGPKGYRRADERIKEDVCDRLTQHGQIDASDIDVQVQNGEVTLSGVVDDRPAKRMAEDVVESVSGVKDVHNQLKVRPRPATPAAAPEPSPAALSGGEGFSGPLPSGLPV
jgi:osmotically-inducible protein OsmY